MHTINGHVWVSSHPISLSPNLLMSACTTAFTPDATASTAEKLRPTCQATSPPQGVMCVPGSVIVVVPVAAQPMCGVLQQAVSTSVRGASSPHCMPFTPLAVRSPQVQARAPNKHTCWVSAAEDARHFRSLIYGVILEADQH